MLIVEPVAQKYLFDPQPNSSAFHSKIVIWTRSKNKVAKQKGAIITLHLNLFQSQTGRAHCLLQNCKICQLHFCSFLSFLFQFSLFSFSQVALLSSLPLAESLLLDPRSQLALAWASPTDLQLYNVHHCEIFQFSKL